MPQVCIVIPCFNEEHRLRGEEILQFLHEQPQATVCFVDDGSSDRTVDVLDRLEKSTPHSVLVLRLPVNQGKAEAVRQGMLHAARSGRFALVGFWDADMSTPLREVNGMLRILESDASCGLVMGSRVRRMGSQIHRSAVRHYVGRMFSTLASLLLQLPVYDTQCGAKLVRTDLVDTLFCDRFLTQWIFDVEMLARLRNALGRDRMLATVTEMPLTEWKEVGGSKIRPAHVAQVPLELLKIAARYNRGRRSPARPAGSR
jgi:glycosyltransferase involved in cell wall biosynthesis